MTPPPAIVLAGGAARRMGGGDKVLMCLAGRPLLAHVLARIGPQAGPIALSANGDPARFAVFGLPVLPDPVAGRPGPLAGILAGLAWAAALGAARLLVVPGDTPFLSADLAARLAAGRRAAPGAFALRDGRAHPVIGLWPVAARAALAEALESPGSRKVEERARALGLVPVRFETGGPDPFFNVNEPADLAEAEKRLDQGAAAGARRSGPAPPRSG